MAARNSKEYVSYQATMCILRKLLHDGLLSVEEYREMEAYFAKKYGLEFSIIYR